MIVYKRKGETPYPVAVECAVMEHPERDADGETIYINTHFLTEAECWTCIRSNARAGVELAGSSVGQIKTQLQKAQVMAGDCAEYFTEVEDNFRRWQREQEEASGK